MRITWREEKARRNRLKHGLGFDLAAQVFADPLARTVWDRAVDGEERWRTFGVVAMGNGFKLVVVVHTYPDLDDETWVHVISLREATPHERRQFEISQL